MGLAATGSCLARVQSCPTANEQHGERWPCRLSLPHSLLPLPGSRSTLPESRANLRRLRWTNPPPRRRRLLLLPGATVNPALAQKFPTCQSGSWVVSSSMTRLHPTRLW
ncbi:unnamed protein product, partial [Scytosiphon promiscuus]